jgi:predicted DNA-binding transcriptional regulator YafY
VGRDTDRQAVRTFALVRARELAADRSRLETPDFERPADFDIAAYILLPFQFGTETIEALLAFDDSASWRAEQLTHSRGERTEVAGEIRWKIEARSRDRLVRWVVENGPGIRILEPAALAADAAARIREVAQAHA